MAVPNIAIHFADYKKIIFMSGDYIDAKQIADAFLVNAKRINCERKIIGYQGTYKGTALYVLSSDISIPSFSIYATELFTQYGVEEIFLINSCCAMNVDLKLGDIILGMSTHTKVNVRQKRLQSLKFEVFADPYVLETFLNCSDKLNVKLLMGDELTSNNFYNLHSEEFLSIEKLGILDVEREASGLLGVATEFEKKH
jgi:purine-nucleoside phosphorylase